MTNGSIVRVRHGLKCSANTAEILTLCCALEAVQQAISPRTKFSFLTNQISAEPLGVELSGTRVVPQNTISQVQVRRLHANGKDDPIAGPNARPAQLSVHVHGDSQIALKWLCVAAGLPHRGKAKVSKGSSPEFQAAILRLHRACQGLTITCAWLGRAHAVAVFGH